MSVTSRYVFFGEFFNSPVNIINTVDATSHAFSESLTGSLLTVDRPNNELAIDIGAKVINNANTGLVANELIDVGATLTSKLRVQGVPWFRVPYFFQRPLSHNLGDMLVRFDFDFHIETPIYCSDADGTLSAYIFLFLDSQGHLHGQVDGGWFSYSGGHPFCTGHISDGLNAAIPGFLKQVNQILQPALAQAADAKFSKLYFLPGNGTKAPGFAFQDATKDVTLGLLLA